MSVLVEACLGGASTWFYRTRVTRALSRVYLVQSLHVYDRAPKTPEVLCTL